MKKGFQEKPKYLSVQIAREVHDASGKGDSTVWEINANIRIRRDCDLAGTLCEKMTFGEAVEVAIDGAVFFAEVSSIEISD